ncbi:MAG: DMT family transporter, partial [bacterium]
MTREKLTFGAMGVLLLLCSIWGINMVAIKISNQGLAPVTAAAFRSTVASIIIIIWMYFRKIRLFHRGAPLVWGLWAGALFGLEFLLLYAGLNYTSASRAVVLLYTCPFVVALGAHFYLPDDRLTW